MTIMPHRAAHTTDPCSIGAQLAALGLLPEGWDRQAGGDAETVIDLSNSTAVTAPKATVTEPPYRPGDHKIEAEAALRMWEDACDQPGGEYTGWYYAVSALIHAVLNVGEAVREVRP